MIILPDGYKQRDNKKFGYYEDNKGKRHYYTPNNSDERKKAKMRASQAKKDFSNRLKGHRP